MARWMDEKTEANTEIRLDQNRYRNQEWNREWNENRTGSEIENRLVLEQTVAPEFISITGLMIPLSWLDTYIMIEKPESRLGPESISKTKPGLKSKEETTSDSWLTA
ncbi:hypothetical protein EVAR_61796_1 [Eumeta japonica]|uniref:Uncharacterized protein n=1 Tax=Eumeta variegata TaxID=151549 RepID=A0A4C1Z3V7_EUMVA|nr:hypothetical protein EVAR_61796_1 [Eumeta japonica]